MFTVHATKKLLDRVGRPGPAAESTTLLGPWYATALFWKPQVALFVNERTLLPLLMPLAPASTLLDRFPTHLADVLTAHGTPAEIIDRELAQMGESCLAKTANRSVVGVMNEFTYLADVHRSRTSAPDLLDFSLRLATTPCGPLYSRHVSPDRELAALLHAVPPPENIHDS
ncbi:hypothetical protein HGB48_05820 [Actinomadura latina]|uniref:DUF6933 domain-containing protein n=2 Tax=Actinomadura latina TaxID=163603 RepID=A0A846YXQ6_9ACTN|nr:hypothetical protein [Actinomadura latina]